MYIKSSFPDQDKVPDCNAYEALWNRHEQGGWPDDIILHIDGITGTKRTYQEFRTRVILSATALGTHVTENGEMIAIVSHNSLVREIQVPQCWSLIHYDLQDYAVLVHSLLLLATPFALFDAAWTPFEFENALKLTKPTRLFVQDQLLPTFVSVVENMGMEYIYILGQKVEGLRNFEEMVENTRSRAMALVSPRPATRDTLAYLIFSSGTTGPPKGL